MSLLCDHGQSLCCSRHSDVGEFPVRVEVVGWPPWAAEHDVWELEPFRARNRRENDLGLRVGKHPFRFIRVDVKYVDAATIQLLRNSIRN